MVLDSPCLSLTVALETDAAGNLGHLIETWEHQRKTWGKRRKHRKRHAESENDWELEEQIE